MDTKRRQELDKLVMWAKISLSPANFEIWKTENLCPEEYFTGRDGILYDWCERCDYLNQIHDCSNEPCRIKNENRNTDE